MQIFHTLLTTALLATSFVAARPADHSNVVRDSELFVREPLKSCIGLVCGDTETPNQLALHERHDVGIRVLSAFAVW
ncbi:uncharacterized protein KD926_011700 [Aspergillus affinis]|uniref:uncharacterized protein n=1 Tax=Aspergillus affinis TaxID=1070780 RepID=UPI0022FED54B|nr:uncharacterized protein KD926_011700 [Aspergillus affinis]KAI9044730.1 hypothetical protein KD926_011700 [Aspergillus affinis]